jgi:predicted MFS family arabinose efflux permease
MFRDLGRTFESLHIHNFAVLWTGSLVAFVAFFMSTVVQSIVAFDLTGKNGAVGIVLMGQGLATLFLGPFGGALADRMSKKVLSQFCQAVIAIVFFTIGVLIATDEIRILYLFLGSFVIGMMFSLMGPARQAWVVELVGPSLRGNAVALNQVALNAARIVGPAIGGGFVAVAFIGAAGAYFFMGVLYVGVVISLFLLPPSQSTPTGRSVFGDLAEGISYVTSQPRLRAMMALFILVILIGLPYVTVMPGLVENELGQDVAAYGWLQTAGAVGGLGASLLVAPLADSPKALLVYTSAAFGFGITLALVGLSQTYLITFLPMFLMGLTSGAFQTLNSAVIVNESDPRYYGRVMSLTMLAFSGFQLISLPLGLLADEIGERGTLMLMGAAVCVVTVILSPIIARAPSSRPEGELEPAPVVVGNDRRMR